jgi:hypothetical protein
VRISFIPLTNFAGTIMPDENNTPPPPEGELKFQMQAMTKMGGKNEFHGAEKCGNETRTTTQDVRKVGDEQTPNNGSRAERPRWADYEDFGEDVDDFGDETIG